jgi:3-deoxy-D-manno-octulosonic-acid transferase
MFFKLTYHVIWWILCIPMYFIRKHSKHLGGSFSELSGTSIKAPCDIWIHAASGGDVNTIRPTIQLLVPHASILLTVNTRSGRDAARSIPGEVSSYYRPLDHPLIVASFLKRLRPKLIVLEYLEFWPGMLLAARTQRIPVILVNGRISAKTCRHIAKVKGFRRLILETLRYACMRHVDDLSRLQELGVIDSQCTGNPKYDSIPRSDDYSAIPIEVPEKKSLIVHGSIHQDEFELACTATKTAKAWAFAALAPRYPELAMNLHTRLTNAGVKSTLLSTWDKCTDPPDAVVIDQFGLLTKFYANADLSIIYGSFGHRGGQNVLESISAGSTTVFGPNMRNFYDIAKDLVDEGLAHQMTAQDLLSAVRNRVEWPPPNSGRVKEFIDRRRGATQKNADTIIQWLKRTENPS